MSLQGYNPYTYAQGFRNQEFHQAVLSVSGTWHTLYLDGVQVAQNLSGGNVFASYQTITNTVIGAQTTLAQAFQGTIGDVRIYNYAIPQTLVTSLYRDRELIVYYPFDTSVNNLTPNYATLVYDASMVGGATTTASANVGTGALSLTNTAGSVATQYVIGSPGIAGQVGWKMDVTHGITIACWIKVAGVANQIQRIFDIPLSVNRKGLSIDVSGTNMLYSGWNLPVGTGSGGSTFTNGSYKYHVFTTSSGTFTVSTAPITVEYLIIGGGGAGGSSHGGGGGAGRVRRGTYSANVGSYAVTVGAGGVPSSTYASGSGGNSSVFSITSEGGGYGASATCTLTVARNAVSGGSGGGGGGYIASINGASAIRTSATDDYGNTGGNGYQNAPAGGGGGGGGSGTIGSATFSKAGGNGGDGTPAVAVSAFLIGIYASMPNEWQTKVNFSGTYYIAGGGGGGTWTNSFAGGTGGKGGGGPGSNLLSTPAPASCNGIANTGSGGGGGGDNAGSIGASGGSGIVVIRYL